MGRRLRLASASVQPYAFDGGVLLALLGIAIGSRRVVIAGVIATWYGCGMIVRMVAASLAEITRRLDTVQPRVSTAPPFTWGTLFTALDSDLRLLPQRVASLEDTTARLNDAVELLVAQQTARSAPPSIIQ